MRSFLLGVVTTIIFVSSSAFATITGKELLNNCLGKSNSSEQPSPRADNRDFCIGYVAGFLDTYVLTAALHRVNPDNRHFCLGNKGISYNQAINIAVNYLQKHPRDLNDTARNLLVKAFSQSYPCNKSNYAPKNQDENFQQEDDRYQNI